MHWHYIRDKALETLKRQAEREGGHILILPSDNSKEAGGLSSRTLDLSSIGKGSESSETDKGKSEKSGDGGDVISGKLIQGLDDRSEEEVLAIVRGHIEEVLSDEGVDGVTQESVRLKN